jgi:hypothetical protein
MKSLLAVCLMMWSVSAAAQAQHMPGWMKVRVVMLDESYAARRVEPEAVEALAARDRQVRARRIVAAGAGFMLAAAITPAYVLPTRNTCFSEDGPAARRSLLAAAGVGAIGLAGAAGGATWLAIESRRHGYQSSRRERVRAAGIGALTFVLGQVVLGSIYFVDQICNS